MNAIKRFFQWLIGLLLGKRRRQEYGGGSGPFPDTGTGNPLGLTANIKLTASIGFPDPKPDLADPESHFDVDVSNPSGTNATVTAIDIQGLTPVGSSPATASGLPWNPTGLNDSVPAGRSSEECGGNVTFDAGGAPGEGDSYTITEGSISYTYTNEQGPQIGSIGLTNATVDVETTPATCEAVATQNRAKS